jgi:S-DNA-T family DNA segregation ATPase FtsK/SpoIIIE
MERVWKTPAGEYSTLYNDMLHQTHLLVAGATGAGKSTVVNGIVHAALFNAPCDVEFILIDPKGTELSDYSNLPHTIKYAQATEDCIKALEYGLQLVQTRFHDMKRRKLKTFDGSDIYIIIDELMFLLNRPQLKKQAMNLLQDILVIARAARVHVIACTQSPTAATGLPVNLRCNFDSRLALRTSTAQDSRNIIGIKGCEKFPDPKTANTAYGYYMRGANMDLYKLPLTPPEEITRLVKYWTGKAGKGKIRLFNRG